MKIVIDIPEEDYNPIYKIYHGYEYSHTLGLAGRIYYAVANGVILPKGCGRLIDADALNFNADYNEPLISKLDFEQAPTIIEADKEISNEDNN